MSLRKAPKALVGQIVVDKKTKNLLVRIKANQIAVLHHLDIDEIAASGLLEKKIKAIINFSPSISGKYPSQGLKKLLSARIPVFDVVKGDESFSFLVDGQEVTVDESANSLIVELGERAIRIPVKRWSYKKWEQIYRLANHNVEGELDRFIDNTLEYARKEKDFVLKPLPVPRLKTKIKGKHVVVVVRGNNYREDLSAVRSYIEDCRPILVGVDGGADALIESGLVPDIIIGDMDSVSDSALQSGAELIVHAYPDGSAPGLIRVHQLGGQAQIIPSIGTSEDVAMLMAYEEQAELIVALGAHLHMVDFL